LTFVPLPLTTRKYIRPKQNILKNQLLRQILEAMLKEVQKLYALAEISKEEYEERLLQITNQLLSLPKEEDETGES
jgi:ribonuclease D